ncbi:MAG: DNA-binding protein [Actinomycetota bacterium]|nr:DNA-binding protein [Actinomycetota bacterium]
MDLVGAQEIADMLGITRQRVGQLARNDSTFPTPVADIAAGRIWKREDVERWARETGRLGEEESR